MIHPLTVLTFAAFFGAGLYVFQTKEEAARLDRELRDIKRATEQERAQTQVFQAEWARLNDQERLRNLATAHLRELEPTPAAQFARMEDAVRRLPAPVAFQVSDLSGFARRPDAPGRPGEPLVVTLASLEQEERAASPRGPVVAQATPAAIVRNTEAPQPPPPPVALPPVTNPLSGATGREASAPAPSAPRPAAATPAAAPRPAPAAPSLPNRGLDAAPANQALSGATARGASARPAPRPAPPATELAARRDLAPVAAPLAPPTVVAHAQPAAALASAAPAGGSLLAAGARGGSLPPPVPPSAR